MSPDKINALLNAVATGETTVAEASTILQRFPMDEVVEQGQVVARLDTHRRIRQGFAEVVLAEGKQFDHLVRVTERALEHGEDFLITRVFGKRAKKLLARFPKLTHAQRANCLYYRGKEDEGIGLVVVLCAGTSDIGVAEEAAVTARLMGARVVTHYDAGVAGLHRLLAANELLRTGRVFIVAAGMEGALPSVVGGLVDKPVIAVPTSTGSFASPALLGFFRSPVPRVLTASSNLRRAWAKQPTWMISGLDATE